MGGKWRPVAVVEEGDMLPAWHGIASQDWCRRRYRTAVVPLNWAISAGMCVWAFLRFGNRGIASNPRIAYLQGVKDGRQTNN